MYRRVEFGKILTRIERIALAHYVANSVGRVRHSLAVAMAADHHRAICIKFQRVYYLAVDTFIG